MYNLLMRSSMDQNQWKANQGRPYDVRLFSDRSPGDRVLEYTADAIKQRFTRNGVPDFGALKELPCLFTYEGLDVAGYIGRISTVKFEGQAFEITYTLPDVYPTIRLNDDSVFESLGIGVGQSWERSRTHWAVKDVDLFETTTRLLHDRTPAPVILSAAEMRNVWGDDYRRRTRVFLSHSAYYSGNAAQVKARLEQRELSCFLAHQDATPSLEWQEEISKALNTMDIFVGLVTDDFHRGGWIDQEIGRAVQRGVFRVFAKLGHQDPIGMVAREQALITDWDPAADAIVAHLTRLGKLGR